MRNLCCLVCVQNMVVYSCLQSLCDIRCVSRCTGSSPGCVAPGLGSGAGVEESAVLTVCLGPLSPVGTGGPSIMLYLHIPFVNSLET